MININKVTNGTKVTTSDSISEENAIKTIDNRITVNTDSGTIIRPDIPSTGINLDNSDFFEERSNPLSSKGN